MSISDQKRADQRQRFVDQVYQGLIVSCQALSHEPLYGAEIMARMAPIFEIMRLAAKTEPEIADMLQNILQNRLGGMREFIKYLSARQTLPEDLTPETAADTVWAITSAEVYSLLITDRSWSSQQYENWLAQTLTKLLLK